jgi:manganese/zinc/iron transport system substrate-binding protein
MLIMGLFALLLMGCSTETQEAPSGEEGTLQIVVTTGMVGDLVRNVGGERVQVTQLMGAGVDPHVYTAAESDVNRLLSADMIFYNGLFLEARIERVLQNLAADRPSIPVGERIPEELRLSSEEYDGRSDPHLWMDVKLWQRGVEVVRDALTEFDPAHAALYAANAAAYLEELAALEVFAQEQVARLAPEQRILVTAHDAFHYFAAGYGFQVFAPQGISTEAEAGVEDIRAIIDLVVSNQVPAIFVESSVSPDVVQAIVEGARARGHNLRIGGELFSDAMGTAGTPEGTYIGMIRHNITTIVDALVQE